MVRMYQNIYLMKYIKRLKNKNYYTFIHDKFPLKLMNNYCPFTAFMLCLCYNRDKKTIEMNL